MSHYGSAFEYYSKFDVGPVLVIILTDMCDLYLTNYTSSEESLKLITGNNKDLKLSLKIVRNLLGGAFLSLLDCRYCFTEVVVTRYKEQMPNLVQRVYSLICRVLLKMLTSDLLQTSERLRTQIKLAYRELVSVPQCHSSACLEEVLSAAKQLYEALDRLSKLDLGFHASIKLS